MKQLVSILIPAFNAEKWLSGCIESAIAQTWPWKEIIIVDDGSRDKTLEIARGYEAPNIKVLYQANKGASAARNHALSMAQGDYIQWLDADDLLAPDKIEWQLKDAEPGKTSNVLLSGAWGSFYQLPESSKYAPDALWTDLTPTEWMYRKIDQNLWMAIESWLVSRKLTEMAGPWNESLSLDDDGEYFRRVISCAVGIRFIPAAKCFCRKSTFGISHTLTLNDNKLESQLASILAHIQMLRDMEDSPRIRTACIKLINRWAIYFYPNRPDLIQQMQAIATDIGGGIVTPRLHGKYHWMKNIFGWNIAKKTQYIMPVIRSLIDSNMELIHSHIYTKEDKV